MTEDMTAMEAEIDMTKATDNVPDREIEENEMTETDGKYLIKVGLNFRRLT